MARTSASGSSRSGVGRRYHAWVLLLALGLLAGGSVRAEPGLRVVSLTPVATEILLALGHADHLVALDPASARVPGVQRVPVVAGTSVGAFTPDLVLVSSRDALAVRRAVPDAEVLEAEPHNFDDAWELFRAVGAAFGREAEARRYVLEISRPLAERGAASFGRRRPRVVAVLQLEPFEIAGGHSFVTDLVELAGGENVSHGTEEPRLAWSPEQIARSAPELILLVGPNAPGADEIGFVRAHLGPGARIEPLVIEAERFWLYEAEPVLDLLRGWLDPLRAAPPR